MQWLICFIPKILTSYVESVDSFWGKKITIGKTINIKLKKIYFIKINSDNPQMQPKKSANLPQILLSNVYCHQKAKYYKHITIQQLDWTCWNSCCCNSRGEILKRQIKVLKCKHSFCLNCLAACLSGKNEEESQCPECKMNILKADISSSSYLQTLLPLLKIQCNTFSKKLLINAHYNHNCSLDISPPSSLLVTDIFNISDNGIPRLVEDATLHVLKK